MDFQLTADQQDLQARARELARGSLEARAAETDRSEQYPWDNVEDLKNGGFMGMTIPKAYGGQGRTFFDATLVIEQMAQVCGVTGRIVVESNMGAISTVMKYGTEDQKRMAAEFVLNGDKPAICITEPEAGSAATEMTTRADKRGDKYIINGKSIGLQALAHPVYTSFLPAFLMSKAKNWVLAAFCASGTKHRGLALAIANPQWACAVYRKLR